jgi:16S rRNA processing protein RimM
VTTPEGREGLVPFVKALVPEVDIAGGRVVIADRPGLVTPLPEDGHDG